MIVLDPLTFLLALLLWPKKQAPASRRPAAARLDTPGFSVFPVSLSEASFSPDYNAATHQGVDIFATSGTAVFAPESGEVRFTTDPLGGRVFYLKGASGMTYYGAHMTGYVGTDRTARAGEQIGFVGTTGNASGGPAHLHFQINGGKTDPYPFLHALAPNAPVAPWARTPVA